MGHLAATEINHPPEGQVTSQEKEDDDQNDDKAYGEFIQFLNDCRLSPVTREMAADGRKALKITTRYYVSLERQREVSNY